MVINPLRGTHSKGSSLDLAANAWSSLLGGLWDVAHCYSFLTVAIHHYKTVTRSSASSLPADIWEWPYLWFEMQRVTRAFSRPLVNIDRSASAPATSTP